MQVNCTKDYSSYEVKTEEDIKQAADLAYEIWHEHWRNKMQHEQIVYMLEKFQSFEAIKGQIENENCVYKILKYKEKNAGYFGVCKVAGVGKYLFLSKIYIKKNYRRKGLGQLAFKEIKDIAKELKLDAIRLHVNKYNANAIKAYEKWGFKIVNAFVKEIGQDFIMDDYAMEFRL